MNFATSFYHAWFAAIGQDVVDSGLPSEREPYWRTRQIIRHRSAQRRSTIQKQAVAPAFCGKRFVALGLFGRRLVTGSGQERRDGAAVFNVPDANFAVKSA